MTLPYVGYMDVIMRNVGLLAGRRTIIDRLYGRVIRGTDQGHVDICLPCIGTMTGPSKIVLMGT